MEGNDLKASVGVGLFIIPIYLFLILQTTQNDYALSTETILAMIALRLNNGIWEYFPQIAQSAADKIAA